MHIIVCVTPDYPSIKPVIAVLVEVTEKQREPYDIQIKVHVRYNYEIENNKMEFHFLIFLYTSLIEYVTIATIFLESHN